MFINCWLGLMANKGCPGQEPVGTAGPDLVGLRGGLRNPSWAPRQQSGIGHSKSPTPLVQRHPQAPPQIRRSAASTFSFTKTKSTSPDQHLSNLLLQRLRSRTPVGAGLSKEAVLLRFWRDPGPAKSLAESNKAPGDPPSPSRRPPQPQPNIP